MKVNRLLLLTLAAIQTIGLAACGGGGGGGGGGNPNPEFTETVVLAQPDGAAFNAALAINDDALVVGTTDGAAAPSILQAAAWIVTPGTVQPPVATSSAIALLALPAGTGPYSAAYGVNDGEVIVGEMVVSASGSIVPAFWADRTAAAAPLALGTATRGSAYGINTAGRIVGEAIDAGVTLAVSWDTTAAAVPTPLPTTTSNPPTTASSAYAVNDFGHIVGELTDAAGTHAVVWRPVAGVYGDPILLPAPADLAGDQIALGINLAGQVVGEVEDTLSGFVHAVRWLPGAGTTFVAVDLGPADSDSGVAGINDFGRTVGYVGPAASAWGGGTLTTPITMDEVLIDSKAFAINNFSQAVGISGGRAFVALR